MKTKNNVSKDTVNPFNGIGNIGSAERNTQNYFIKYIRKIIFIIFLLGTGFLFDACAVGYVATVPLVHEYERPPRPGRLYIWIEGDWVYNRSTHSYERSRGHWAKTRHGRSYDPGHWENTPQGYRWEPGHWHHHSR